MATLLSVNVGLPKDVTWQGRTVHTGIWSARSRARAWPGASTSTATASATAAGTAANSSRSARAARTAAGRGHRPARFPPVKTPGRATAPLGVGRDARSPVAGWPWSWRRTGRCGQGVR